MSNVRPDLLAFIKQRVGTPHKALTRTSPVEEMLGMAELDTIVFYNDFVKHFNIRIPEDWDISNHVSPVGFHDWRHYPRCLFSKSYRRRTAYRDLTISELEAMIKDGCWKL